MPADLDARIRGLVVEVVEHAPPAPDLDLAAEPREAPPRRQAALVSLAIGVAIAVVVVIGAIALEPGSEPLTPASGRGATVTIRLDSIPEGLSGRILRGRPVFLERRGDELFVFFVDSGTACVLPTRGVGDRVVVRLDVVLQGVASGPTPAFDHCRRGVRSGTGFIRLDADSVPAGVSSWYVGRTAVFVVRAGGDVTVFINRAQHIPGERVRWCPVEQVFYAPTHGEQFRADGTVVSGPAQRGLDRLRVRSDNDVVTVDSRGVMRGEPPEPAARVLLRPPPVCEGGIPSLPFS